MKSIVTWFVKNSVPANLLMFFLIIGGIASYQNMKSEFFPIPNLNIISINVAYLGASPSEIESSICSKIEDRLQGISGIEKVSSYSTENSGMVAIHIHSTSEFDEILDEVKTVINSMDNLPVNSEKPIIKEIKMDEKVLDVVIYGNVEENTLLQVTKEINQEIKMLNEVSYTEILGDRNREITIEVSENNLEKYNLNFDQITLAINAGSIDLPGGILSTSKEELLIRTVGQSYNAKEYEKIVIRSQPNGSQLLLKDIATIKDAFVEVEKSYRWNGIPAMFVGVNLVGDQDVLRAAEELRTYVNNKKANMPAGIEIDYFYDQARYLQDRINLLYRNFAIGITLVLLTMFLKPSLAFWVAMGIPISFGGALLILPLIGVSVNILSAFMFIVVLGIVVDDAIIVGENVFRRRITLNEDNYTSTINGTMEVLVPVFFGVLTTIAVFAPMLNLAGQTGSIWKMFPLTAIPILALSLIESTTILPSHLNNAGDWFKTNFVTFGKLLSRARNFCSNRLYHFVDNFWIPLVKKAMDQRYTAIAIFTGLLLISFSLVAGGWVKWTFFPILEGEEISIAFELPEGSPINRTQEVVSIIEREALQLKNEINSTSPSIIISNVLTTAGEQYYSKEESTKGPGGFTVRSTSTPHIGEVVVILTPADERWNLTGAYDIIDILRERIGTISGVERLSYSASIFNAGKPIDFEFQGNNFENLKAAVEQTKILLSSFPGIYELNDSNQKGKSELQIELLPSAEVYGITTLDIAKQVRQAFFGEEVQRIQRDDDDIRVMLKLPKEERRTMATLENMRIRTNQGIKVPLYSVARIQEIEGYSKIKRSDGMRVIEVQAEVDVSKNTSGMILQNLIGGESKPKGELAIILDQYQDIQFALGGEPKEQAEQLEDIAYKFAIAIFAIYVLLAIPLKSYFKPLIVLSAIPYGMVGAILGHLLFGVNLSVLSLLGIVALSGVVVNDSLLLVVFINRKMEEGVAVRDAVVHSVRTRFRPVVLTSITTFLGIMPLLFNQSTQVLFLKPMAISLGIGILFSTTIILLLVPVSYVIINDFLKLMKFK
jgi:multidrug efflux pump subunit AcrB